MADQRRTHDADRIFTALAFRYGERVWRSDPMRAPGSKPVQHRLASAYHDGRHVPKDGPDGPFAELIAAVPLCALIVRSPLRALLRGDDLDAEHLRKCITSDGLGQLGSEFRALAVIEETIVQMEIDLATAPVEVARERLREAEHRFAKATAPRLISDYAAQFEQVMRAKASAWRTRFDELDALARRITLLPDDSVIAQPAPSGGDPSPVPEPEKETEAALPYEVEGRLSYPHLVIALAVVFALPWLPLNPLAIVAAAVMLTVNTGCAVSPAMRAFGKRPTSAK